MSSSESVDMVELQLALHAETAKAWLVSPTERAADGCWIPRSLALRGDEPCGGFQRLRKGGGVKLIPIFSFTLPRFLAVSKGLTISRSAA